MPFIQFQQRRDTAALWTSNNPTLASGEMGLETDTSLFKIGNGTTPWVSLPYGGLKGATGATASVSVGTVTTLAPGSTATVTNSGTSYASILNFGIPQGATGGGTGEGITFSGPSGSVLYYDGTSVTGSSFFTFDGTIGATGEVTIAGKLTVLGGIDPLYLNLVPVASNPLDGTTGTLWVNTSGQLNLDSAVVGSTDLTTLNPIAIGTQAGFTGQQDNAIAIGNNAGYDYQQGSAIAIGAFAGNFGQMAYAISIGENAGNTGQQDYAIAIGINSGNTSQKQSAIAIGFQAGNTGQQDNAIAIGALAGYDSQAANTIILNASGSPVNGQVGVTGSFYVAPIRSSTSSYVLGYDIVTNEVTYGVPVAGATGATATVSVGTVTTLAPGSTATVTDVGTSYASVLDFGIPQGATGNGISFTTIDGSGDLNIMYTNGNNYNVGHVVGATGATATVSVGTVTTLAPGSTATVTNSGTSYASILNFGIPQGATGGGTGGISFSGETGAFLYYDGSAVTGTPGLTYDAVNSNIYLPQASTIVAPGSPPLQFQGALVVQNDLRLNEFLLDGTGLHGTPGQVLSSTTTGTQWITPAGATGGGVDLSTLDPIAIGYQAGFTGQQISAVAIGIQAGQLGQKGAAVAIGNQAGQQNQQIDAIAIGNLAGATGQQGLAIAIGRSAGEGYQQTQTVAVGYQAGNGYQQQDAIAIGTQAGFTGQQESAVAIGNSAGYTGQQGYSIAIGTQAANTGQQQGAVAIGAGAGFDSQQINAVAIGNRAANTGQQGYSIAIGNQAGYTGQQGYAIAIGAGAGQNSQAANTIILNASGSVVNGEVGVTSSFYVTPVRGATSSYALGYNPATFEVTYDVPAAGGPTGATATVSVGTVTTLAPGSAATVIDVGTSYASILDFGIPQGETGGSTFSVPTSICATARSVASQGLTANVSENIQHDEVDFAYGITATTGPSGYFEVPSAGVYKIIPSLQINPTGNGHLHVWLKVNGTNADNTATYLAFKNGEYQVFTTEILLELQANDQVQVWAQSSVTGGVIQYIGAGGTSPDDYPAAPGIITNIYKLRDASAPVQN